MRFAWIAGVLHAFVGTALFFLTLHPLRDALDAHALDLMKVGSGWQAMNGLALMILAASTAARIPAMLIAGGVAISAAMLYFLIFTGTQPAIMVLVPIGGAISMIGWIWLLFVRPKS